MRRAALFLGWALLAAPLAAASASEGGRRLSAFQAGTVHLVERGEVLTGGATVLVRDGRIAAVGKDLAIPADAETIDYGPDAVIVPGLIAADSNLAAGWPSPRTAEPGLSAVDGFDFYARHASVLSGGVTSVYITPARTRLLAGQGAVVKLGQGAAGQRVLGEPVCLHGALSAEARNTPGYWEPPIPATSDTGIGVAERQLPRTLVGAMVALRELHAAARAGVPTTAEGQYGPYAAPALAELLAQRSPWRLTVGDEPEIRAALAFASENGLALILDGAERAGALAEEIARAGAAVVFKPQFLPEAPFANRSRSPDVDWPEMDVPARLAAAGVRVAIATFAGANLRDLRFAAALASRGGLDPALALRAITLTPAEIYGVAGRVGSLAPGKDADFAVLNGAPLAPETSVLATWIGGELAWRADESQAVVLEVAELHIGDGRVLRPGQLLMKGGRITEVGERVAHPRGATVVRGAAAMPGAIDALGHLGIGSSTRAPAADFKLSRLVGPGEPADRKIARAGVTTVALSPRGAAGGGSPILAYKPAAEDFEGLVVKEPAALRLRWSERDRAKSGADVRELLEKGAKYRDKWLEFEKASAAWKPDEKAGSKAEEKKAGGAEGEKKDGDAEAAKDEDKKEGAEAGEAKDGEKKDGEAKEGEAKKDDKGKKKKGKDEEEPEPADPVTGVWETKLARPPLAGEAPLRLALKNEKGTVTGSLRCAALSAELVRLEGKFHEKQLTLWGLGSEGLILFAGEIAKAKLTGAVSLGSWQQELEASQTSKEYPVAARPERRKPKDEDKGGEDSAAPKGKPEPPRLDEKLEPLRQAMLGRGAVIVEVERGDEIVACVEAFQNAGVRPVLLGAGEAYKVIERIRGKIAGVLLSLPLLRSDPELGTEVVNRYAELQDAGIPVAFHSASEEGAVDLPLRAAFAVSQGMSPAGALRALTADAARMLAIGDRVGRLEATLDADVLLLDGSPLDVRSSVTRAWVNGREVLP